MVFWGAHVFLHSVITVVLFFYLTNIIFFIKQSIALGMCFKHGSNYKREWTKDKAYPECEMHLEVGMSQDFTLNFGIKILLLFGLSTKFMKRAFYLCVTLTKFFNPPKPLAPHVLNGVIYLYYLLQKIVVRVR